MEKLVSGFSKSWKCLEKVLLQVTLYYFFILENKSRFQNTKKGHILSKQGHFILDFWYFLKENHHICYSLKWEASKNCGHFLPRFLPGYINKAILKDIADIASQIFKTTGNIIKLFKLLNWNNKYFSEGILSRVQLEVLI